MKYTGKMPAPSTDERPVTPESKFQGLSIRSRPGAKSPLRSPARFISQRGGVEALFQGAAKGVFERGEKLGINQAVRDAMGEIRRNMKDLSDARIMVMSSNNNSRATTPTTARHNVFANGSVVSPLDEHRRAVLALEHRNKQLALLLEEAIAGLQHLAASNLDGDKEKNLEAVEMAAAKAQFVKIHLDDSSLDLSLDAATTIQDRDTSPQVILDDALPTVIPSPGGPIVVNDESSSSLMIAEDDEIMTDSEAAGVTTPKLSPSTANLSGVEASPLSPGSQPPPTAAATPSPLRPAAIPTRSTLARSSFSLMLEPDQTAMTASTPASVHSSAGSTHHLPITSKRPSNAFLFGEVVTDDAGSIASGTGGGKGFTSEDIFGLEPLRRPSKARGKYEDLFGGALSDIN